MKEKINISSNWNEEYTKEVIKTALDSGHIICGVKTRKGTPCKKYPSGDNGRCSTPQHNVGAPKGNNNAKGNSGGSAPKGNKNAVKTGEYESIVRSALSEDEKRKFDSVSTTVGDQLDEQIRTAVFREYRMMKRIAKASNKEFHRVEQRYKKGTTGEGAINVRENVKESNIELINRIEEALTRVQGKIARLINIKRKHQKNEPDVSVDIDNYISALEGEAKEVWSDD